MKIKDEFTAHDAVDLLGKNIYVLDCDGKISEHKIINVDITYGGDTLMYYGDDKYITPWHLDRGDHFFITKEAAVAAKYRRRD